MYLTLAQEFAVCFWTGTRSVDERPGTHLRASCDEFVLQGHEETLEAMNVAREFSCAEAWAEDVEGDRRL